MKLAPLLALACTFVVSTTSAQPLGGPYHTGVAPSLPPPSADSGYASNSMFQNTAANYNYNPSPNQGHASYQQPLRTNSWGAESSAGASMLSYNFIDAGYRYIDPKGNSLDGSHGLGVTISMALFNPFFLKAGLNWTSGTGGNTVAAAANANYDFSTLSLAGGVYMPITDKLHFIGEMGFIYANLDADSLGVSYTDGGIYVRPSLRYQALDILEIQGGVTVNSTDDYDSRTIDVGAYLRVMPQLDFNLGADFGDVNRTMKAGVRLRW